MDIDDSSQISTLAIVAKQFMVAYYTDGGIPLAKRNGGGPFLSMYSSRDINNILQQYSSFNAAPPHDTVFLSESTLKTGKFGDETKTFAVPCSAPPLPKFMNIDCNVKVGNLFPDVGDRENFGVRCMKSCSNKVEGTGLYSIES